MGQYANGWTIQDLNPSIGNRLPLFQNIQTSYSAHPASYSKGIKVLNWDKAATVWS
jgi:hypothetical protein